MNLKKRPHKKTGRPKNSGKFPCVLPSTRIDEGLHDIIEELSQYLNVGTAPTIRIVLTRYAEAYLNELKRGDLRHAQDGPTK